MSENRSATTPRMVTYCCTHWWNQTKAPYVNCFDRWLSMLRLTEPGQSVTHINLGQWWWAPKRDGSLLFLNDDPWDEPNGNPNDINGRIFNEVNQVKAKGIKVLAQLTFFWGEDGFGSNEGFNEGVYFQLRRMLSKSGFDGVDLDVEDHATDNAKVTAVIKRLKKDFGSDFLITMAPGGRELLDKDASEYGQLSSIYYKDLYKDIGSEIAWFSVQCYNSWGELTLSDFESFMKAGTKNVVYPADKIVMSVASNWQNANSHDWTTGAKIKQNLPQILSAHPNMGGISCWEWYNAVLKPVEKGQDVLHPEEWFRFVYKIMRG